MRALLHVRRGLFFLVRCGWGVCELQYMGVSNGRVGCVCSAQFHKVKSSSAKQMVEIYTKIATNTKIAPLLAPGTITLSFEPQAKCFSLVKP